MSHRIIPSLKELFLTYTKIGILGFGGVAAVARLTIIEDRQWLDDHEYATLLGIGQVIPGANTINMAVMIGERYQGRLGSFVCVTGIMFLPTIIVILLAIAYEQYSALPYMQTALIGASAAAAGTFLGTGLKMLGKAKRLPSDYVIMGLAIAFVTFFHISLMITVMTLIPTAIGIQWITSR